MEQGEVLLELNTWKAKDCEACVLQKLTRVPQTYFPTHFLWSNSLLWGMSDMITIGFVLNVKDCPGWDSLNLKVMWEEPDLPGKVRLAKFLKLDVRTTFSIFELNTKIPFPVEEVSVL